MLYVNIDSRYYYGIAVIKKLSNLALGSHTFQVFNSDPELGARYKELLESDEDELGKLRTIWEMIKAKRK